MTRASPYNSPPLSGTIASRATSAERARLLWPLDERTDRIHPQRRYRARARGRPTRHRAARRRERRGAQGPGPWRRGEQRGVGDGAGREKTAARDCRDHPRQSGTPARGRGGVRRGRGIHQFPDGASVLVWRTAPRRGRRRALLASANRRRAQGAGRVSFGQSDRAAHGRPRPQRRARRHARAHARGKRLRGHARVLLQQRRTPDAAARRIRACALPRRDRPSGYDARRRLPGRIHPRRRARAGQATRRDARRRGRYRRFFARQPRRRFLPTSAAPASAWESASTSSPTNSISSAAARSMR